jgi:hypothetical protein
MKKSKNIILTLTQLTTLFCVTFMAMACTSLIQKTGDLLNGNISKEKTTAVFRSEKRPRIEVKEIRAENGEKALIISSGAYMGLTLRGVIPKDGALSFTQADILSTHVHGWNQITLELLGQGSFNVNGDKSTLSVPHAPETVLISSGKIRYKDDRMSGADSQAYLRNRRERILAITGWMKGHTTQEFSSQKEFEKYWKPHLFPELASRSSRPLTYTGKDAQWVQDNGVKWNDNYTKALFPDELWEIRNSGALLRDWEEAASWIYIEYSWDAIAASFNGLELTKK